MKSNRLKRKKRRNKKRVPHQVFIAHSKEVDPETIASMLRDAVEVFEKISSIIFKDSDPFKAKPITLSPITLSFGEGLILKNKKIAQPPKFAQYLAWLLPQVHRESLVGDLVEQYPKVRLKFGKRKADFWAYMQVITSVGALITTLISKLRRSTQ
jgi:hypothetical protein